MSTTSIICARCQASLKLPAGMPVGLRPKCPRCGTIVVMPTEPSASRPRLHPLAVLVIVFAGGFFLLLLGGGLLYVCLQGETKSSPAVSDEGPPQVEDTTPPARVAARIKVASSKPFMVVAPETQTKVNEATKRGLAFLRQTQFLDGPKGGSWQVQGLQQSGVGLTALAGLTLLECNVPETDRAVQAAAKYVRENVIGDLGGHGTYQVALSTLFLCRLDDSKDRALIRSLALRLVASQKISGGWAYDSNSMSPEAEAYLLQMLQAWPNTGANPRLKRGHAAGVFQMVPTNADSNFWLGNKDKSDNSNTQFALLALWAARRYDLPLDPPLQLVARRFRNSQAPDGQWYYMPDRPMVNYPNATMTAAGLLGLAVGYGLDNDTKIKSSMADDAVLQGGLKRLAEKIGKPGDDIEHPPTMYFLWSVERVAVLYQLAKIDGKDWYHWGVEILDATQHKDPAKKEYGSWYLGGVGSFDIPDTCFALLFLQQANLIKDLTDKLRQLLAAMQQSPRKE